MKVLIIQTEYQKSYWDLNHIMRFTAKKPAFPQKELLLISILLPITWDRKIIDMNYDRLQKSDLLDADYIIINATEKQYNSTISLINKCAAVGSKVVGCGALFTEYFGEFGHLDHLVLDNIRTTLPELINDIENDHPKKVYHSNPFFEIRKASESYYSVKTISGKFSENIQFAYY